jgi:type I restriction enzyme S subunit
MNKEIPEDWDKFRLGEISNVEMGQSPSSASYTEVHRGLPFLQGNADFGARSPMPKIYCTKPTKICKKDDILISVRAPVGDLNIADQEYCIGRGLAAIRGKPAKVWQSFLFYELLSERRQLYRLMQGTTFEAVNRIDLISTLLIVPSSLEKQKKIAEILQCTDNAIDTTKKLIEKYTKMKHGLTQSLFDVNQLIGKERKLSECCIFIRDGTHGSYKDSENGVPLLSAKDVVNGKIIRDNNPRRISLRDYYSIHSKYELKEGDVVLTIVGTIGRSAVLRKLTEKFTFQRSVAILRPKRELISSYLYHYTNTFKFQKNLEMAVTASAQGGVYLGALNKIPIIIPDDPKSQEEIVNILDSIDDKIDIEQSYLEKLTKIKSGLMQDLLTGKVRVAA